MADFNPEEQIFEVIIDRLLSRVPDDVDKREGAIIYDSLAPAAEELALVYEQLAIALSLPFGSTATGEYLDLRAIDYGATRRPASAAIHKGEFKGAGGVLFDVPIGSKYSANNIVMTATERISAGTFELTVDVAGSTGNAAYGNLLPLDYINGLETGVIVSLLVPGADTEIDEAFRARYLEDVRTPSTSGNKADHKKWALEVPGVGDAYVVPLWNGPGSVKTFILDANKKPASATLVADVQAYIDPHINGDGEGAAPVGATTTISAAGSVVLTISADLTLTGTRTIEQVQSDYEAVVNAYLLGLAFTVDATVRYVYLGSMLLDIPGVQDYENLLVNGGTGNIAVPNGSVAVLGEVSFT